MENIDAQLRGPLMSFFLRRLRNKAEAEDMTQQVFIRLLGHSEPERIENVNAFAFKIATNLLRDRGRASLRRTEVGGGDPEGEGEAAAYLVEELSPERVLLARETLEEVVQSLNELNETTRNVFVLFRLEGLKQREISTRLGLSRSQVEKHVAKAIVHLAQKHGSH